MDLWVKGNAFGFRSWMGNQAKLDTQEKGILKLSEKVRQEKEEEYLKGQMPNFPQSPPLS